MIGAVAAALVLAAAPAWVAQQAPRREPPRATNTGRPRSAARPDVYYPNCAAARAAGVAPLRRGDPGYRAGLDRDGDGIACEARR